MSGADHPHISSCHGVLHGSLPLVEYWIRGSTRLRLRRRPLGSFGCRASFALMAPPVDYKPR